MHGIYRRIRVPDSGRKAPAVMAVILQSTALLAVVTVIRETHPDPAVARGQWANIGPVAEFFGLAPALTLLAFTGVTSLFCLLGEVERPRPATATVVLAALAGGTAFLAPELLALGAWTGVWGMFGGVAAILTVDSALTFLSLRYLDAPARVNCNWYP